MPNRYPQEAALSDGRRILIRPFASSDTEALYSFFLRLPGDTRRLAWDRIEDRSLIESWGQNIDYAHVLPLLALDGREIVADASLHRRDHGPLRLVGRVKWLIDPEYRKVGLGTLLVNHFIGKAREIGLRHLSCMLVNELEEDAIEVLQQLGFNTIEVPGYGADPDGTPRDMTKLILEL